MANSKKASNVTHAATQSELDERTVEVLTIEELDGTHGEITVDSLPKTSKEVNEAIRKAAHSASATNHLYQIAACSAILHLATHSDIRIIRNLLETMPNGMKRAMSLYIHKFAPVSVDDNTVFHFDKTRIKEWKSTGIAKCIAQQWNKVKTESEYRPFNLVEATKFLLQQAKKKAVKADPEKGDVVTAALIDVLEKAQNKMLIMAQTQIEENEAEAA